VLIITSAVSNRPREEATKNAVRPFLCIRIATDSLVDNDRVFDRTTDLFQVWLDHGVIQENGGYPGHVLGGSNVQTCKLSVGLLPVDEGAALLQLNQFIQDVKNKTGRFKITAITTV
jgi:hypothetical protein